MTHKHIITVFLLQIIFFNQTWGNFNYNSFQLPNEENCELVTKNVRIREAKVIDSILFPILDSALIQIKIEPVNGRNFPYAYTLSIKSISRTYKQIILTASNSYSIYDNDELSILPSSMLFNYKGHQIIVLTDPNDTASSEFLNTTGNSSDYKLYLFKVKGKEQSICGIGTQISQEIIFDAKKTGGRHLYRMYQYRYRLDDYPFIFGEE